MPEITYREALRQALGEEMTRDDRVYLLGEDIGAYGGSYAVTRGFLTEWGPKRVIDTPIAEGGILGVATGAAMNGLRPIVEIMSFNFILLALDQICNHAAKLHHMFNGQITVPLVVRTAAGWGQLAATHSQTFEQWFAAIPGLKVVMPATPADAKGLLVAAIRDPDPVLFIEHSLLYGTRGEVPEGDYETPIGVSEIKREGSDVTIVTYSRSLLLATAAATELAKQGFEAEIVDLRTLRPLDMAPVLASVKKTNRALIVEEDWRTLGIGAELAARIQEEAFDDLDAPVMRLAGAEVPLPYARNLEKLAFPTEQDVVAAALRLLNR